METKPNPRIIEDLKAAGEELKMSPPLARQNFPKENLGGLAKRSVAAELPKTTRVTPSFAPAAAKALAGKKATEGKETTTRPPHPPTAFGGGPLIDLPKKIEEYQKEISQEQSALEKTYQKVKELEKRLGERIEFLRGLQTKGIEINKELKEFEEQFTLAKKANRNLLEEVKNKLKGENE